MLCSRIRSPAVATLSSGLSAPALSAASSFNAGDFCSDDFFVFDTDKLKVSSLGRKTTFDEFYDFMPTAAELAGVEAPKGIDGLSILPTLLGKGNQKKHEYLYWELPRHNGKTGEFPQETPMQAMRMGDWKAVRPKPNGPLELYNLKNDVGEANDVGASNPKILAKMEALLKTARVEPRPQKDPPTRPERWKNT